MTTHTATATSPDTAAQPATKEHRKSLIASTVGQLLEWYEWGAYAVFAPFIAAVIFDPNDPVAGLLATFGVFAVGFLMRPLGGMVFGAIADRRGRKFVLIATMLSMAVASVAIGLLPGFEKVGIWSAILLLVLRMVQGFAHGGESATANTYIAEIAPRHQRGVWSSLVYASIFGGTVIAYTIGGAITTALPNDAVASWGWRIPFWLGAVLAVVALWLRRGMQESEVFEGDAATPAAPATREDNAPPTRRTALAASGRPKSQLRSILLIVGMISGVTAANYTWTSYVSTYAIKEEGMAPLGAYWATVFAQLIALIALPFWGKLSDRIGRKPLLFGFAVAMLIVQFPLKALIGDAPWTLFAASALALLVVGAAGAILSAVMSEVFPTASRTKNIGIAYSVSVAVFGGFAPYLNQLFVSMDLSWLADAYVMLLCVVTFISVRLLPETKGIDLSKV